MSTSFSENNSASTLLQTATSPNYWASVKTQSTPISSSQSSMDGFFMITSTSLERIKKKESLEKQ